jgi:hypothetical protein
VANGRAHLAAPSAPTARTSAAPRASLREILLNEPAPCDVCRHVARCAARHLACAAFGAYIDSRPWQLAPRQADAARYRRLFHDAQPPAGADASAGAGGAAAAQDSGLTLAHELALAGANDSQELSVTSP